MKTALTILLTTILAFATVAFSGQKIQDIPWDEANIKRLRAVDKPEVLSFFNEDLSPGERYSESDFDFFEHHWYPAGGGKYELAITSQSGPDIGYLTFYWQDAPGKIRSQEFARAGDASDSWYWEENGPDVIDVNGDGVPEVIDLDDIDNHPPPQRTKFIPGGMWPRVYRLRDGKYVEASRDFPAFYDKTVFPMIDKAMAKAQQDFKDVQTSILAPNIDPNELRKEARRQLERTLAGLIMCRDKILRVLGRDPNAGLAQAREWISNPDPVMVDNARVVFQDIGGHDEEVRAARLATDRASKNWPNKAW